MSKPVSLAVIGKLPISLIYVEDVAELIRALLKAPSPKYKIYNTGGHSTTLAQIADIVYRFIPSAKIEFGTKPGELPPAKRVSNNRAKEELGFSLRSLEDGVLAQINDTRMDMGLNPIAL